MLPKIPTKLQKRIYLSCSAVMLLNGLLYYNAHRYVDSFPFVIVAMLCAILWYVLHVTKDDDEPKPPTRGIGGLSPA